MLIIYNLYNRYGNYITQAYIVHNYAVQYVRLIRPMGPS